MDGVTLTLEDSGLFLRIRVDTSEVKGKLKASDMLQLLQDSAQRDFLVFDGSLVKIEQEVHNAKENNSHKIIDERIAEKRDAEVQFSVLDSDMAAEIVMTTAQGGKNPSLNQLIKLARKAGIRKGLGKNHLQRIVDRANKEEPPGSVIREIIAKGLPARNGRPSRLSPLVPNALERILQPQEVSKSRVDMRDLGDIICVKAQTPVLQRLPPSNGRNGYTVRGETLTPVAGEWLPIKAGSGIMVSPDDENLLLAEISGMPKFQNGDMWVDETYITKGVNVGTGNINYEGAVIVNGDVTEKMIIIATGDVTINGFVESAHIQAGGDIIITQGAMGKQSDTDTTEYNTKLIAKGSVHVQHGQGLDISCSGNVTVGKQLAHSRIVCGGGVIVGPIDNPNGNLFGCEIQCQDEVRAGVIGAVSGSNLFIDFSDGYNFLIERKDEFEELLKQLQNNYYRHKGKVDIIRKKRMPKELSEKVERIMSLYKGEEKLLDWVTKKTEALRKAKDDYLLITRMRASKKIHPGVVLKLNNRTWKADREYSNGQVYYFEHQWHFKPD
jgi:uncharacterized protein